MNSKPYRPYTEYPEVEKLLLEQDWKGIPIDEINQIKLEIRHWASDYNYLLKINDILIKNGIKEETDLAKIIIITRPMPYFQLNLMISMLIILINVFKWYWIGI